MRKAKETTILALSLSLLFSTEVYSQNLYNGLVACYSFSGNANDGSGNNNNGTVKGAALTSDRFGNPSSAYKFNGVSNYVSIPSIEFENAQYTFAAWVYIQAYSLAGMDIFSVGDSLQWPHQALAIDDQFGNSVCGIFYNRVLSPHDSSICFEGNNPGLQTWVHLVFTKSSNRVELFINGVSAAGEGLGLAPVPPDFGITIKANIGARSNLNQFFNGIIDDIVIYDRPLSVEEVLQLYEQGVPCSPIPLSPVTNSPTICGSDSTIIIASGVSTAIFHWYDAASAGNLLFEGNPFKTPILSTTTDYYVSSVINNVEGPRTKVIVKVFPAVQETCSIPNTAQTDLPISISANVTSGTAPFNYLFDLGNGTNVSSLQSSITYKYDQPGFYKIAISVTDANNCSAICTGDIQVIKQLPIPTVRDTSLCGKGLARLLAVGGDTYRWYDAPAGGNLLFVGNPYVTPILSNTTDYFVSDFENNFESPRAKVLVTVFPQPQLNCSVPLEVVDGDPLTISITTVSGTPPFKYSFDFGDGIQITSEQQSATHRYDQFGTYATNLSVSDSNGCFATCEDSIRAIEIFIPNVITANNDALNDKLTVFKKANNYWESYEGSIPFSMVIVNRWGDPVYNTNNSAIGWNGENVSTGVYFFDIKFGEKKYNGWVCVVR